MSSKKTTDKSVLRYPYDALTEETDYLEITAFDYVRPSQKRRGEVDL
jgi:hypothetical protein